MAVHVIGHAPPCVAFEDDHLLVVRKPAGWNTHAPAPYAGEGIYDWLRNRERRWSELAIIHRLDKDTSGLMVFGKTPLANRSLTQQFGDREIVKRYVLVTESKPMETSLGWVKCGIDRQGSRYVAAAPGRGEIAETHFKLGERTRQGWAIEAQPRTGRTHQIRVHAAERGFPVLGDKLYGGAPFHRMCLHARHLGLVHPESGQPVEFDWPPDFDLPVAGGLRNAIIDDRETDAFRMIHGPADGCEGWFVDRLGAFDLVQTDTGTSEIPSHLRKIINSGGSASYQGRGCYLKRLVRGVGKSQPRRVEPKLVDGEAAPDPFFVRENGVKFELRMTEGYSVGLFMDQRDNRRRLLARHIAVGFPLLKDRAGPVTLLNAFAYTCGFSVCGAMAGFHATSLDLSRKNLDWGRRNFALNGLDSSEHDFIFGDAFDWFCRLAKKGRQFDLVMLDPPTFSRSREAGTFSAEKDYSRLAFESLPLVAKGGLLFASTNATRMEPEKFLGAIREAAARRGRRIVREHFAPQPPDFPIAPEAPGHLKTLWAQLD
jgi:23S rRNA (cytosine1962-C5)-methyltransferase